MEISINKNEIYEKILNKFKEVTKKDCYSISILDEEPNILDNKIGGKPYLPIGEEYPKDSEGEYMGLLFQINLKDIELENYPNKGILEIYTDNKLDYPCQYVVKYFDDDLEYQTDLPEVNTEEYVTSKSNKIILKKDVSYMNYADYRFNETLLKVVNELFNTNLTIEDDISDYFKELVNDEEFDVVEKLMEDIENPYVMFGGYANFTQTDPREWENQDKEECVFVLDSNISDDFDIGDCGIFFVLGSRDDIKNGDFSKLLVDWDCC